MSAQQCEHLRRVDVVSGWGGEARSEIANTVCRDCGAVKFPDSSFGASLEECIFENGEGVIMFHTASGRGRAYPEGAFLKIERRYVARWEDEP